MHRPSPAASSAEEREDLGFAFAHRRSGDSSTCDPAITMEKKLLHLMFGDDPVSVVESACLRLCYEQDPNCPLINIGHLALYLDCSMDVQVILEMWLRGFCETWLRCMCVINDGSLCLSRGLTVCCFVFVRRSSRLCS